MTSNESRFPARVNGSPETQWHNETGRRAALRSRTAQGSDKRAQQRPVPGAYTSPWRSESAHVGTRKMVNYARAGRAQRKLWWRSKAIVTCKYIVRSGYRGERPIEPSSSWFPPKFPSG
ncbi:hypothetical protein MRX96_035779 [Rhipicephalus microplus]